LSNKLYATTVLTSTVWDTWFDAVGLGGMYTSHGPHFSHSTLALEAAMASSGVVATTLELSEGALIRGQPHCTISAGSKAQIQLLSDQKSGCISTRSRQAIPSLAAKASGYPQYLVFRFIKTFDSIH
jgi:hypothetical protein